jgi:hypothetical protein
MDKTAGEGVGVRKPAVTSVWFSLLQSQKNHKKNLWSRDQTNNHFLSSGWDWIKLTLMEKKPKRTSEKLTATE